MSTRDQNLELQLDAPNKAGCKRIFTDKLSGAQVERPGLQEALSHSREADTLVVCKLDRLGRSVKGLVDLVNELDTQKVHFQSITDGVDTKTPAGRFFFHVMASLAQMERELILERTRAGLEAARCQGRIGGRKRRMTDGKVQAARKLLASGTPPQEVAHSLGVSVPTLSMGFATVLLLQERGSRELNRVRAREVAVFDIFDVHWFPLKGSREVIRDFP
jgi:DNA invertase Pin-like site-specific DNA recombinase